MSLEILREIKKFLSWNFRFVKEGDDNYDPKPFDKFNALSCVLEFIQNALDALSNKAKSVLIKIYNTRVSYSDFKDNFLKEDFGVFLKNSSVPRIKNVFDKNQDFNCLILEDYNTTGIKGDPNIYKSILENGEENHIHQFNYEIGGKRKLKLANLGGSEGEGRQTFCQSSDLSMFFYYTIREDGTEHFMGMFYSGIFDYSGKTYKPYAHFGNIVESKENPGNFWTLPINDPRHIEKFKNLFKIKRKKEAGLTVIIPYIDHEVTIDQIQKEVCTKYRVPLFRGDIKLQVGNATPIGKENLLNFYQDNFCETSTDKDLLKDYFVFLEQCINKKIDKSVKISINPSNPTYLDSSVLINPEIKSEYKKREILKFEVPFTVYKKKNNPEELTDEIEELQTKLIIFMQKYPDYVSEQFKYCDTVRGNMPITDTRKKTSNFFLTIIDETEAKLLVKTGEVANHSKIKRDHAKYKALYKENSQKPIISFINNAFYSLQELLIDSQEELDDSTTLDLCAILSDKDFDDSKNQIEKKSEDDDEDTEEEVFTTKTGLPKIPKKLKAYIASPVNDKLSNVGWQVTGVSYTKEQIEQNETKANDFIKQAKNFLKLNSKNVRNKEVQEINAQIISAKNRLKEYYDFKKRNYSFFPIKINIKAAYDDGSSDPFSSYCDEDFDFNDTKNFRFQLKGNVSLLKNNENQIVLEASKSDFLFSFSGFGKNSEEKIIINHNYISQD